MSGLEAHEAIDSLPLMGIGNTCAASTCRAPSAAHYPSGDWEPGHPSRQTNLSAPSLPLMGIGNSDLRGRQPGLPRSLPLMGIGNDEALRDLDPSVHSLPLMGIGNWERIRLPG